MSRRFIDDETGCASSSSSYMDDECYEHEEPEFISEKCLEGLEGDMLREKTLLLVYQEMHAIMPPTNIGAKQYLLHLAALYVSAKTSIGWEAALEEFTTVFDVGQECFNDFPLFYLRKTMETAEREGKKGVKIDDKVWTTLWFIQGQHQ